MLDNNLTVKHAELVKKYALSMFPGEPNIQLVSIDIRKTLNGYFGPIESQEFELFVDTAVRSKHNLYVTPNKVRSTFGGTKPKKADIEAIRCVFMDLDPIKGEPWDSEQKRINVIATGLAMSPTPPTFLVSTGGGIQAMWVLDAPLSTKHGPLAELIGRKLAEKYLGDSVQNIDRLLRMPGSINWPDEHKKAKGQKPKAATPQIWTPEVRYSLSTLSEMSGIPGDAFAGLFDGSRLISDYAPELKLKPPSGDEWEELANSIDWVRVHSHIDIKENKDLKRDFAEALARDSRLQARWSGSAEGLSDSSRSGMDFSLMAMIKRYGFSATQAFQILLSYAYGRGAEADRRYLCRLWLRSGTPPVEDEFSQFLDEEKVASVQQEAKAETQTSNVVSLSEVRLKVANGGSVALALAEQDPEPAENDDPIVEEYVRKYNKNHALVILGGKPTILNEEDNTFWALASFKEYYAGDRIPSGQKTLPATECYRSAINTRRYSGVVFDPSGPITYGEENWRTKAQATNGKYNMWRGFSTKPALLDGEDLKDHQPQVASDDNTTRRTNTAKAVSRCHKFLTHIRENICRNDQNLYREFMGFHAHIVQNPGDRPDKALVVVGEKGTGKSFVFERIADMIGSGHAVVLTTREQLTGRFNGILAGKVYVVADEASFGFDPSQDGILKNLITQSHIHIEYKGSERVSVKNCNRYVFLSNSKLPVFVSPDERRYVVFKISSAHRQDEGYFADIDQEWKNGGRQAFMRYLMEYNIERSGWSPHKSYRSEHLKEMQFAAQSPAESFVYDSMVFGGFWIGGTNTGGQGEAVALERVYDLYVRYSQSRGQRHTASMAEFRRTLGDMLSNTAVFSVNELGVMTVEITDIGQANLRVTEYVTGTNLT